LLPEADLPHFQHIPVEPRWITETVQQEVIDKLGTEHAYKRLRAHYRILRFNNMYRDDPGICPVYYWYISSMYNPANVGSGEFIEDLYRSKLIKGLPVEPDEHKGYRKLRRSSSAGHTHEPTGELKSELGRRLERAASKTRKKAMEAIRDKHPAYMRDIKSLALMLYYCLYTRQNVIYYTADVDPITHLLKWLESMCMRMTLLRFVLPSLVVFEPAYVMSGQTMTVTIDVLRFIRYRHRLALGFLNDKQKTKACRFSIKRWDQTNHGFEDDIYMWFEDRVAGMLANMHGPLSCHYTRNYPDANCLNMFYHWPPLEEDRGLLRVEVARKAIANRRSTRVDPLVHDKACQYRRDDSNGTIASWSQFYDFDLEGPRKI
jgi:hypothetical protein